MKISFLCISIVFIQIISKAQVDTINFNSYLVLAQENFIKAEDAQGKLVFQKQFNRPYEYRADIDADQFDELVIVDSIITNGRLNFTIYFLSGEKNFNLIDSIYSGSFFPFITYSEEIESMIIETGSPEFEKFNQSGEVSALPVNFWKLENDELFLVNDELYEPFIFENKNLIQYIDFYSHEKTIDCSTSQLYRGIIASAFANYINAGEQSLATQMLKKYYSCDDVELFKQEIIDLIFPKAKE
jgi:hypothetical protein